jgi:hypothetical protein
MIPTATSTPWTLASLSLNHDLSFSFVLSPWLIAVLVGLSILYFVIRWLIGWSLGPNFQLDTAEVGLSGGTISFKPNTDDQQVAYKIWVELSTRKIGLPIDLDHDVISEVYDSWYNFFSITRELIKDIPVNKVKGKSTQKIIRLSISVLNDGLRPHLTSWQTRFRHWYDRQLQDAKDDIDPQSIQAKYPKYDELKNDMMVVNERLMKYREKMEELVLGKPKKKKE